MNNTIPEISVVILCYKASAFAPAFVKTVKESLKSRGLSYQLVLVANYKRTEKDTDLTPETIRGIALQDPSIVVVAKEKEGMMGWDMLSGLAEARGETIAVIDGDGQMPAEDIVKVYNALTEKNADCAKTYRVKRDDGLRRFLISRIYNFFLKILFPKVRLQDANSKPKIFTKNALSKLRLLSTDWFIDAEMMIQASYLGFSIVEVPTVFHENKYRRSFVKPTAMLEFIRNLVVYRFTRMHELKR